MEEGLTYDTFKAWIILGATTVEKEPKNPEDNTAVHDFGLLRAFVSSTHAQWKGKLPVHRNLQQNRKCQR